MLILFQNNFNGNKNNVQTDVSNLINNILKLQICDVRSGVTFRNFETD